MMYTKRIIIPGIILFAVACLLPFLLNVTAKPYSRPELLLPQGETACIEPVEVMRTEHPRILIQWRDGAVRDGARTYVAISAKAGKNTKVGAKAWEASLQNTCMRCHTNQQQFCGVCHDSNSVRPDCWTCHIAPETINAGPVAVNGENAP